MHTIDIHVYTVLCVGLDTSDATVPRPSLHSAISLDDTASLDSSEKSAERDSEGEKETAMNEMTEDTDSVFQLLPDS